MSDGGTDRGGRLTVALLVGVAAALSLVARGAPAKAGPQGRAADGADRGGERRSDGQGESGRERRGGPGGDTAPGDETSGQSDVAAGIRGYLIGLALAGLLTVVSFTVARSGLVWGPGVPMALVVFAVAQMGVHLVFFIHITTSPDSTNNVLALAFGTLIVFLLIAGSLWIMANLNANMMPMDEIMKMQR